MNDKVVVNNGQIVAMLAAFTEKFLLQHTNIEQPMNPNLHNDLMADAISFVLSPDCETFKTEPSDWEDEEPKKEMKKQEFLESEGWYKSDYDPKWMGYFDGKRFLYVISAFGIWFDFREKNGRLNDMGVNRKASPEEIESHLIAEAKRRGLVYEETIKSLDNDGEIILSTCGSYQYDEHFDRMYFCGCLIYEKGQWTELVKTISKGDAERQLGKKII